MTENQRRADEYLCENYGRGCYTDDNVDEIAALMDEAEARKKAEIVAWLNHGVEAWLTEMKISLPPGMSTLLLAIADKIEKMP